MKSKINIFFQILIFLKKIYVKSNFYLNLKIKVIFKTYRSIEKYRDINTL